MLFVLYFYHKDDKFAVIRMSTLPTEYIRLYSNFFNRSYLIDYINKNSPRIISQLTESNNLQLISEISNYTYTDFFEYIYSQMKVNYKCEYFYLNEILKNEILKKHDHDHRVLTELKINNSAADLVVINGTTTVYEIKTELDSFSRLEGQLSDYVKAIDKVYVVTHKSMVEKLSSYLDTVFPTVGIYILNRNNRLKLIKKAESNRFQFDITIMFKILNRKDFEFFSKDYYEAREEFYSLSIDECHKFLKFSLYERTKELDYLNNIPDSLKLATFKIDNNLNNRQRSKYLKKLNKKLKEDL